MMPIACLVEVCRCRKWSSKESKSYRFFYRASAWRAGLVYFTISVCPSDCDKPIYAYYI